MKITTKYIQTSRGEATLVRMENAAGAAVELSSIGAGIISIVVPDRVGRMADVVLGYAEPELYLYDGPCMGKTPGRYANRIARGIFYLDGREYRLAVNCGPNALHGGPEGFHNKIWNTHVEESGVVFTYTSPDGEEGYPGRLDVAVRYTWDEDNNLGIEFRATADSSTVVNLTNHSYFNLSGHGSGSVLGHHLLLNASRFLLTDSSLAPTGEIVPVDDTPMDFRRAKPLGQDIEADFTPLRYAKGFDNCWALDGQIGILRQAAILSDTESGRILEVLTTQPAVQIYTGNWLDGSPKGKDWCTYHDYDGVAIECQGMPDAPNHPHFPSQTVGPGSQYHHITVFKFSTK